MRTIRFLFRTFFKRAIPKQACKLQPIESKKSDQRSRNVWLRVIRTLDRVRMPDRYASHVMASITDSHVRNQSFGQRKELEKQGCRNVSLSYPKRYRVTAVQNGLQVWPAPFFLLLFYQRSKRSHTLCEIKSVSNLSQFSPHQYEGISTQIPFNITPLNLFKSPMSFDGSPSIRIKSASLPFSIVPRRSWMLKNSAL